MQELRLRGANFIERKLSAGEAVTQQNERTIGSAVRTEDGCGRWEFRRGLPHVTAAGTLHGDIDAGKQGGRCRERSSAAGVAVALWGIIDWKLHILLSLQLVGIRLMKHVHG